MINLQDGKITDLLNNGLRYNPETIAMGYALLEEKRRIIALAAKTRLMSAIDTIDEKTLDYLAVELRTPAYSDAFPVEIKRKLVRDTLPFYARLGTPAAVNWLVNTIFGAGTMEEWFEYDGEPGEPHHFRVNIGVNNTAVTPENLNEFRRMIASVKRLSSWLDNIISKVTMPPVTLYFGPVFHETRSDTALPYLEPSMRAAVFHLAPAMSHGLMTTQLPTLETPTWPHRASFRISAAAHSAMQTRLPFLEDAESDITVKGIMHPSGAFQSSVQTKLPILKEETA